jgi:hypothetical protein
MNSYNFTDEVRRALEAAREEALRLRHKRVGTEHLLLGIATRPGSVTQQVLGALGLAPESLVDAINRSVVSGPNPPEVTGPDLPYAPRAKKVLELAMTEARELNHTYVGTEHLFLGLLREQKGIGAQVLADAGVSLEAARQHVLACASPSSPEVARTAYVTTVREMHHRLVPGALTFVLSLTLVGSLNLLWGAPASWAPWQAVAVSLPVLATVMSGSVCLFFRHRYRLLVLVGLAYVIGLLEWRLRAR